MAGTINEINPRIDQTVRIYDEFYNYAEDVPSSEYDVVLSYFKSVFNTVEQAQTFTVSIFRVAQETNTSALVILDSIKGPNGPELTLNLCYFLNSVRSNATLLGLLKPTAPNYWAARNVRS